jgi:hypothetical protein
VSGGTAVAKRKVEQMKSRRLRMLGACLTAAVALSAVAVAQASAIEFIYKVKGAPLSGKKELTSKAETSQVLKATVLGVASEITCTTVETPGALITGGVPGTSTETVHYGSCTVQKPSGCKVKEGKITTNALEDEIVEGVGLSKGLAEVLFKPAGGAKAFAEVKLEGFFCPTVTVEGSILAEAIPQAKEVETGLLKFEPAEKTKYKNSKGEEKTAGTTVGGKAATTTGTVETKLNPIEVFGIF